MPGMGCIGNAVVVAGVVVAALVACGGLTACSTPAASAGRPSAVDAAGPPEVQISPANGSGNVRPDRPVVVRAVHGVFDEVTARSRAGALAGTFDATRQTWTSTLLTPDTMYLIHATATGGHGASAAANSLFGTLTPARMLSFSVSPAGGSTVGVGTSITVRFDAPVSDRAAVQRRLHLMSSTSVRGAWHWDGNSDVRYRPQLPWPAHTRIMLDADLTGVDAGAGTWGAASRTVRWQVGDLHWSVVDLAAHTMTVTSGGQVVRTFPISGGRPDRPTMSGVHDVLFKTPSMIFDSPADGYRLTSDWDVNFTSGGEFVHSAPWSVGSQGHANVSHGCVNASPADAEWFYDFSQVGDLIDVVNSPRPPDLTQDGTTWAWPWDQWLAGDALRPTPT